MQYSKQQILEIVNNQLLLWIKKDEAVKNAVFELVQTKYSTRKETDDKFDRVLKELANDREAQSRKWDAQEKKWDDRIAEDKKKWDDRIAEDKKKWDNWIAEDKKKWDDRIAEDKKKWDNWIAEDKKKWDNWIAEDKKKWDAQEKKWEKNQKVINQMLHDIEVQNKKITVSIGAIGTRWGMASEASFRDGLKSILETDFPVKVINYNKMDNECLVYKRPRSVEIDVIVHNGKIILCEISASFSSDEVDAFVKKIEFYEKMENVKISRAMIISPMMTPQAIEEAKYYNIEVFTYPEKKMF